MAATATEQATAAIAGVRDEGYAEGYRKGLADGKRAPDAEGVLLMVRSILSDASSRLADVDEQASVELSTMAGEVDALLARDADGRRRRSRRELPRQPEPTELVDDEEKPHGA